MHVSYITSGGSRGGGSLGSDNPPLRPGVVVENARTACSEAVPFPLCDF